MARIRDAKDLKSLIIDNTDAPPTTVNTTGSVQVTGGTPQLRCPVCNRLLLASDQTAVRDFASYPQVTVHATPCAPAIDRASRLIVENSIVSS